MALHLNRDYLVQTPASTRSPSSYVLALFLRRVLGYTFVGHTNYDINAVGTLLIATGDSNPTGAPNFLPGSRAGINNGTGAYHVTIPIGVRTVVAGDVGRLLVLKSTVNPRQNSGVFLITAIDTTSGRNDYVINWRSGDSPPAEGTDTMQWWLYAADSLAPATLGTPNGGTGYRSNGSSTTPRVILQSPHATAWQVRICHESSADFTTNTTVPLVSTTVGFNGNASGDFPVAGRHVHGVLWNDASSNRYAGLAPGTADNSTNQYRLTIVGDDTGQAVAMFGRNVTSSQHWMIVFGLPDNEVVPLPIDPLFRIFSIGSRGVQSGITFANISTNSADSINAGSVWGQQNQPVSCTTGCWTFSNGPSQGGTPFADSTAGDSPFTGVTDLVTVDIVGGAFHSYNSSTFSNVIPQEPRVLGSVPFLRQGRTNFGLHTLTTDRNWQHMRNGVYMPWGGPAVLP